MREAPIFCPFADFGATSPVPSSLVGLASAIFEGPPLHLNSLLTVEADRSSFAEMERIDGPQTSPAKSPLDQLASALDEHGIVMLAECLPSLKVSAE